MYSCFPVTINRGREYLSTIRDIDTDASIGILEGPPDLEQLDWDEIKTRIHNLLLKKRLFSLDDIQRRQSDLEWAVYSAVIKSIFKLYQTNNNDELYQNDSKHSEKDV